ncbi:hypothetical protein [Streptomyces celluloflavus]|uniref:hypothetical protein n=1 Tax=Streptomyces celluloflavus TaxID=58344 RepID=UPI003678AA69
MLVQEGGLRRDGLYGFLSRSLSRDLVGLGISHVEAAIVSRAAERTPAPVQPAPGGRGRVNAASKGDN